MALVFRHPEEGDDAQVGGGPTPSRTEAGEESRARCESGEELEASFWPAEPIPSGERRGIWVEVMAPEARTEGRFTLKLWEADGQRTFVIGNVTFPVLKEEPGP